MFQPGYILNLLQLNKDEILSSIKEGKTIYEFSLPDLRNLIQQVDSGLLRDFDTHVLNPTTVSGDDMVYMFNEPYVYMFNNFNLGVGKKIYFKNPVNIILVKGTATVAGEIHADGLISEYLKPEFTLGEISDPYPLKLRFTPIEYDGDITLIKGFGGAGGGGGGVTASLSFGKAEDGRTIGFNYGGTGGDGANGANGDNATDHITNTQIANTITDPLYPVSKIGYGGPGGHGVSLQGPTGAPGKGGGLIILIAETLIFEEGSKISSVGSSGSNGVNSDVVSIVSGASGGGGGGIAVLYADTITNNGLSSEVSGGSGGTVTGSGAYTGFSGGNGGNGIILNIEY